MQLDKLVLFNADGETRPIEFTPGALNIITGDSRTGKSSLINIVRFLLGSGKPNVPFGPIQESVAWYALHAHVNDTSFFIARKAPAAGHESNDVMLVVGDIATPPLDELQHNTSRGALREYLGGLLGVEDNRNDPRLGQTRRALTASFVHALYYCFQGQGEIANPEILFHRQNREWIPQTIRDTLPYFLGAQGADDLRKREELVDRRRDLRRLTQRLRAAESERAAGLDRAGALLAESVDVGLLADRLEVADLAAAQAELRRIVDNPAAVAEAVESGAEFDRLRDRRRELSDRVRDLGEQLRAVEQFAAADHDHSTELVEQQARLASIGLIPAEDADATCALCGQSLGEDAGPRDAVEHERRRHRKRHELGGVPPHDLPRSAGLLHHTPAARPVVHRPRPAQPGVLPTRP